MATLAACLTACTAPAVSPSVSASVSASPTGPASAASTRAVSFAAADGVTVSGRLSGTGATAVVLSNMGDNDPTAWERFAATLAGQGYRVLTYGYRYPARTRTLTAAMAKSAVDDLRGAIAYVRSQGSERVVLIGASLGGMATAKAGGAMRVAAVVIIAAPIDRPDLDLRVGPGDLAAITAPKLFVASDDDPTVLVGETRQMYDLAPAPKRWLTYPGAAHGTQLLDTEHADSFRGALVDFVIGSTPTGT